MAHNTPRIRPTDNQPISHARSLIMSARYGDLALLHPETNTPIATRIAHRPSTEGGRVRR